MYIYKICISSNKVFISFQNHLILLMRALRDYIAEQNQEVIVTAIRTLKEELDFDSTAITHLNLAIYLFQTAVNEVLRMHSIKPHWMFALDNLVRNAVQAAINVFSPGNIKIISYVTRYNIFLNILFTYFLIIYQIYI